MCVFVRVCVYSSKVGQALRPWSHTTEKGPFDWYRSGRSSTHNIIPPQAASISSTYTLYTVTVLCVSDSIGVTGCACTLTSIVWVCIFIFRKNIRYMNVHLSVLLKGLCVCVCVCAVCGVWWGRSPLTSSNNTRKRSARIRAPRLCSFPVIVSASAILKKHIL